MPIRPQHLQPGDVVGLIAPASTGASAEVIERSVAALRDIGFKVKLGRHVRKRNGFLAGHDKERAGDVMAMFADRAVKGIFCVRGGYGSARLLPLLDYVAIRRNPKVFIGFSDLTSLHCALRKKSDLVTFYGPMTVSFLAEKSPRFLRESLWRAVAGPGAPASILQGYHRKTVEVVRRGKVSAELIGGNLSVLSTVLGTPYQPDFRGRILFLEDVDEKPYAVDRLLTHLFNAGVLSQAAGVAIGIFHDCVDPKAIRGGEYRQTVEDVLRERLWPLKVPVVIGLPFGHVPHNATLPIGGRATLDADNGDLIITHAAVK